MKLFPFRSLLRRVTVYIFNFKYGNILPLSCRVDFKTRIIIKNKRQLKIGENILLNSSPKGYHAAMPFPSTILVDVPKAKLEIGDNTRVNGAFIHSQSSIHIGKNCVIASGVNIIDSNGHQVNSNNRTIGRDNPAPIFIGDNVWIGINSIILKGTSIGNNCVISAGSVVKGSYSDNVIIQGNPAIVVGHIKS